MAKLITALLFADDENKSGLRTCVYLS